VPFCPRCRDEFQDWVKVCPDCQVELVDVLPEPTPKPEKPPPLEPLVTVGVYSYALEAHLDKARLASEGIDSAVIDEHIIIANWLFTIPVGGVKLQVRESDANLARSALKDVVTTTDEKSTETGQYPDDERCPQCRSVDIRYEPFHIRSIYIFWFIMAVFIGGISPYAAGFSLPILKRKWKCNTCGYEWKIPKLLKKEDRALFG
jgi:predicted Zn-ribbon and HTH transcriptional regulator